LALALTVPRLVLLASELDEATLQGCRAGDPAALRVFVTRYEHLVFAFISRSLGAGPHVEDLAQEVFLRACRALGNFHVSGQARLSTWILTIARRLIIDARRKRRLPIAAVDADEVVVAGNTPETERRRHEIASAIERAAVELSDDQRDAFLLAEFHGLDTKELATVLGISEATAKTRLFRARERLRAVLRDVWEDQ
jgi:RNA polymerase sigma-70 factor (ECF subfamily)